MNGKKLFCRRTVIYTVLIFLAFTISLDIRDTGNTAFETFILNLIGGFRKYTVADLVLLPGIYLVLKWLDNKVPVEDKARKTWSIRGLAALFSFFMVFGYSFEKTNSWDLVIGISHAEIFKAAVVYAGYYCLFRECLRLAFTLADRLAEKKADIGVRKGTGLSGSYLRALRSRPFLTVFVTLIILYIPYSVVAYPGTLMGDGYTQITQAFSELKTGGIGYMTAERLLKDGVYINQHHPVVHTMLIHWCLVLGIKAFGDINTGLFLYSVLQALVFTATVALSISMLLKRSVINAKHAAIIVIYAFAHPVLHNYLMLVTKDIIYACFLMIIMICLFELLLGKKNKTASISLALCCLGMLLFRNDARYILSASFICIALIYKPLRKKAIVFTAGTIVFSILLFDVIFISAGYTPGSRREMLSVPLQQTARYVRDYGDEVTGLEKKAISEVVNYDIIAEKYDPNKSDNVKSQFIESATTKDLMDYFAVWGKMFLKHPGVYVQATMNNYYRYFYPESIKMGRWSSWWSEEIMKRTNDKIEALGLKLKYPESTRRLRDFSNRFFDQIQNSPVFSLLRSPGVYTWIYMVGLFYAIYTRRRQLLAYSIIPVFLILICLLAPVNGEYGRYSYPLIVILPIYIACYLAMNKHCVTKQ